MQGHNQIVVEEQADEDSDESELISSSDDDEEALVPEEGSVCFDNPEDRSPIERMSKMPLTRGLSFKRTN